MIGRLTKIDIHIAVWGALATATATLMGGRAMLPGALLGAVLASLNWLAFRTLVIRMADSAQKLGLGLLLAVKTIAVLVAIALMLKYLPIHPVAFLAGMSGLFLGIVTSTIAGALRPADSALERKP